MHAVTSAIQGCGVTRSVWRTVWATHTSWTPTRWRKRRRCICLNQVCMHACMHTSVLKFNCVWKFTLFRVIPIMQSLHVAWYCPHIRSHIHKFILCLILRVSFCFAEVISAIYDFYLVGSYYFLIYYCFCMQPRPPRLCVYLCRTPLLTPQKSLVWASLASWRRTHVVPKSTTIARRVCVAAPGVEQRRQSTGSPLLPSGSSQTVWSNSLTLHHSCLCRRY